MARKTLFISGKVTGVENYQEKFDRGRAFFESLGYHVMTPALLPPEGWTHEEYMRVCKSMLEVCDTVLFLPGWEDSPGAREEMKTAELLGKHIVILSDVLEGGNGKASAF